MSESRNIKLTIQYDGTNYCGWQIQNNARTVQQEIEQAVKNIVQHDTNLIGSGRTDSGVHALGQVANFKSDTKIPCEKLLRAINYYLPYDIRIIECEEVDSDFHSRFSALKRQYKYIIDNRRIYSVFRKNYATFIREEIDVEKLCRTLKLVQGEHNFTNLCAASDESPNKVRTMYDTSVVKNDTLIEIIFTANAFLRKMIRMIMGCALEINLKKLDEKDILRVINGEIKLKFATASPKGLYLYKIFY